MIGPRYEVWTYITENGERVTEPKRCAGPWWRGRFWTRRGAEDWGRRIVYNPRILLMALDALQRTGRTSLPKYEVRRV